MSISDNQKLKILEKLYSEYRDRDLTKEELQFIYFSHLVDYRMDKIRGARNKKEDLARVFDCTPSEIGLTKDDLYTNQLVFFDNYIIYNNMYDKMRSMGFHLPKQTRFGVILPYVKNPEELILPERVGGTLALPSLESIEGVTLPKSCVFLDLMSLKDGNGLILTDDIRSYDLSNLNTLVGVTLPEHYLYLHYHNNHYDLEEARKLQEEELKTYDPNKKPTVKKYGTRHNWYYKRG